MYRRLLSITSACLLAGVLLVSCNGEPKQSKNDILNNANNGGLSATSLIKINNRLFSIPSPLQVSQLVKQTKLPFMPEILNPTTNSGQYSTTYKQALNLGVYGANLGYLNIYEQLPDAAKYFAVVKMLATDLGIMSTFDKETLQRIDANISNKDSLIYLVSTLYRDADAYLLNNDRNETGVLVLAGGWIESLYFLTQAIKTQPDQAILNRIGEQKYPLDNLIELLRPYYNNQSDDFDSLLESLIELASVFDGIVITYQYSEPIVDPQNKMTTLKSKSETEINDFQLKEITSIVERIREDIIGS